jgi:PAS domain S-box-containing protein
MRSQFSPDPLVSLLRDTVVSLVRRDEVDLSSRQLAVFLTCYLDDVGKTVRGLAEELNVSKPAITRALDRLTDFDLVRRKIDPSDRRSVLVQRTQRGKAFLRETERLMTEANESKPAPPAAAGTELVEAGTKAGDNTLPFPSPNAAWNVATHLDLVLNGLTDHAILTLDLEGNVTSWNSGAERTKGYTSQEIIGRNFACFYTAEDQAAGLPQKALQFARQSGKYIEDGWRVRQDGVRFSASVAIQPFRDETGAVKGFVKVTRDMSSAREAREIAQQLQAEKQSNEMHQSRRLELVGQLTGGVAHDFNNLLTTIEAGHDLVMHMSSDKRLREILRVSKTAVDGSRKLIAQLLTFSGKQLLNPKPSNVCDLAKSLDVLAQRAVGGAVQIHWDLLADAPMASVDQGLFQNVLLNLIMNSRDAMPSGGTINVSVEKLSVFEGSPDFHGLPAGSYVVLAVSDTGAGMSEPVRLQAIEPYFTTKPVGKGSGLGLSQSYGFARQSGGTLLIESKEGCGTTIRVILPAIAKTPPPKTSRTILFVDDDPSIRQMAGMMLRVLGHTVVEAADGREALRIFRENQSIDYLFSDIIMPNEMNGLQLAAACKAINPKVGTLLASGYTRDTLRDFGDIPSDVAFLPKPYTLAEISGHFHAGNVLH